MRRTVLISEVMAWPFLLPRNLACRAFGLTRHRNLVRVLINVLGVLVVVLAT